MDNAKEFKPNTSEVASQSSISVHQLYENKGHDERSLDSNFSSTGYNSVTSGLNDAGDENDPNPQKDNRRSTQDVRRENRQRQYRGRVQKRRRSEVRRRVRRPSKKFRMGRRTDPTLSAVGLSTGSLDSTSACKYCGHRCCPRRYCQRTKKVRFKRMRKNKTPERKRKKMPPSECVQVGSRSAMLSPLLVNTNLNRMAEMNNKDVTHAEITPEMICDSLRALTKWRQEVSIHVIMDYMKRNYPVDPDSKRLLVELQDKLRVAVLIGIVTRSQNETWSLATELLNRRPTKNHVMLFWKMYSDTMKPVVRKAAIVFTPDTQDTETSTAFAYDLYS